MKIKVNDNVLVIAGKDRGKTGKVTRVSEKNMQVVVEKINIRTKHVKKKPGMNSGQILHFEAPIHISNVMLLSPESKKPTRVGYVKLENGKKQRIAKKFPNEALDVKVAKATRKKSK